MGRVSEGGRARADEWRTSVDIGRLRAFIDAVVAIAMTLLILPLLESVGEVARGDGDTAHWFAEHRSQLLGFVVSFALIAVFWIYHHRLFARVDAASPGLLWVTMPWLLAIVWLPVATAISGQMDDDDALAKIVYIGSMIALSLCSLLVRLFLRAHPELHRIPSSMMAAGIAAEVITAGLFAVALLLALAFPVLGYSPLLVMVLTGPAQAVVARWRGGTSR